MLEPSAHQGTFRDTEDTQLAAVSTLFSMVSYVCLHIGSTCKNAAVMLEEFSGKPSAAPVPLQSMIIAIWHDLL
jgi:hypothetical protein